MGSAFVKARFHVQSPKVGLLSIGEESTKGTPLVKETHELLSADAGVNFFGNVEGRDLIPSPVDVIVTDGFTGNVALKTMEGTLRFLVGALTEIFARPDVADAATVIYPYLLPLAAEFEPDNTGGAMLLGVDGVCVISHGSSSSVAMVNAITVAHDLAVAGLVDAVAASVTPQGGQSATE
jgi:glycerol-3-phosphate acyltransferase PlsX